MTTLPGLPTITVKGPFWSAEVDVINVTTPPAAGPTVLLAENFDQLGDGQQPPHWLDTKAENSFEVDDSLFQTSRQAGAIVFGTTAAETNIHSHYAGPGALLWTNYRFTGRLLMTHENGGVGVTFFSHFPAGRDDYYRLRAVRNQPTFHLSPHRQGIGSIDWPHADSGVAAKADTWYQFHIEVRDQGSHTAIRAKIWVAGNPEPTAFQIDVIDESAERLRAGTIGVWTAHAGAKYVDDLRVVTLSDAPPLTLPLGPPLFQADFSGYKAGQDPTGWIDTGANNSTKVDDKQFKTQRIGGQIVFGCQTKADNVHSHVADPAAANWTNYAFSGRMYVDGKSVGVTFFSSYPTPDRDDYYRLRAHKDQPTFHIAPHPHGQRTVKAEGSDSGLQPKNKTWYRFYIEVADDGARTNIRAKIWVDGEAEPPTFQIDTYDDSPNRLRAGTIGLWSDRDGESFYADLLVQPLIQPRPALRMLFLDQQPRAALGEKSLLLPGTLLALCAPKAVTIRPTDRATPAYQWTQNKPPATAVLSIEQLRALLRSGELCLLLLQAEPTAWPRQANKLPDFTCIAGEINLDLLRPRGKQRADLYQALGLAEAALGERPRATALRGALTVHSSGATLYGSVHLPWLPVTERSLAPFQLARTIAPDAAGNAVLQPAYRLTIETDRLTDTERANLIRTWRELSILLNPRNPLHGFGFDQARTTVWTTLEIADPLHVPSLFWQIAAWANTPQLRFAPGEINLRLSDRRLYDQAAPPTSLATIVPTTDIPLQVSSNGDQLTLELVVGHAPAENQGRIVYTADVAQQTEQLTFPELALAFDPVETPRFLRGVQGLSTPEIIEDGEHSLEAEPILWGFVPLADGWAQLPVPNMTEQLYFQAQADHDDGSGLTQNVDLTPQPLLQAGTGENDAPAPLLQGAVAWGNSYADTLNHEHYRNEQAWSLTLTGATYAQGRWTLTRPAATAPFSLTHVTLQVAEPEVIANGFFWLSTGRPRAADALPDLENWVSGLRPIPLRALSRIPASLSPIVQVDFQAVTLTLRTAPVAPSAQLDQWLLVYQINQATVAKLGQAGSLIATAMTDSPPLVWRRHPTLPLIQSLPLTQTLAPPNFPNASRQLAPYQLAAAPMRWELGSLPTAGATTTAASQWPRVLSDMTPAAEWASHPDLPLAALTLPGLYFDPDPNLPDAGLGTTAGQQLPIRYRYDLPYTDQLNALAQVPKTPRNPDEVSPLPDSPPPQPAQPLTRTTLADYWQRLSTQASLATVAAANAIVAHAGQPHVQRLVEPLSWPVAVALNLQDYPGQLQLDNMADQPSAPLSLTGTAALEGISGHFIEEEGRANLLLRTLTAPNGYVVRAGSMETHITADSLRDQRGLVRSLSRHDPQNTQLLFTEVTLHGDPTLADPTLADAAARTYRLMSLTQALPLGVTGSTCWHFWIKDLPAGVADADAHYNFNRTSILSPVLKTLENVDSTAVSVVAINDPEALAREQNYRMGYEWRLGDGAEQTADGAVQPLLINGLYFFPLTLEDVHFAAGEIVQIEVIGRLQLPLADKAELTDLSNAVRLIFTKSPTQTSALTLTAISLASPVVEWPLLLQEGELTNVPRVEWDAIRLDAQQQIIIGGASCRFVLFNQAWAIPLDVFTFGLEPTLVKQTYHFEQAATPRTLIPHQFKLALDCGSGTHTASLQVLIRAGAPLQPALQALVQFPLVQPEANPVQLEAATLFGRLTIDTAAQSIQAVEQALQFVWTGCTTAPEPELAAGEPAPLHFLPGMTLQTASCPGFLALTFTALPPQVAEDSHSRIPVLRLTSAFAETLLTSAWGTFLQHEPGATLSAAQRAAQLFGSSAGDLFIGYTAQWEPATDNPDLDGGHWVGSFLLNGFLEVTNLISWPANIGLEEAQQQLTLPAFNATAEPAHLRHTIRILLNQHQLPAASLVRQPDLDPVTATPLTALFALSPQQPWQFLAVVEHQLLEVRLTAPSAAPAALPEMPAATFPWERRWTALQEVRLLLPATYAAFLADDGSRVIDPVRGIAPRWTLYGHYQAAWVNRLTDPTSPDALHQLGHDLILVEASAPHWIRTQSVETLQAIKSGNKLPADATATEDNSAVTAAPFSGTTLQFLPSGKQAALLSGVADFGPSAPSAPEWQLLTMPFLGRLQDAHFDGLTPTVPAAATQGPGTAPAGTVHPLRVDPVLQLWRQRAGAGVTLSPLMPMLTSWALDAEEQLAFSAFEHAVSRTWARLDPLSLEENWFRLQNPPVEPPFDRVQSVMAALPNTAARLSRAVALQKAFDAFRPYYPPQLVAAAEDGAPANQLTWRQQSVLVWQTDLPPGRDGVPIYPWLPVGIQLSSSALRSAPTGARPHHHAAATLLPARLQVDGKSNPTPVSFAVSPYLGLAHQPAPAQSTLFLASLELLGLDTATNALRPLASLLREETDADALQTWAALWAAEARRRLRPDSPLGVIRLRQLLRAADATSAEETPTPFSSPLITTYAYVLSAPTDLPTALARRVVALRSTIVELRFREGQYGGSTRPQELKPYELAPPLSNGVQPLYIIPQAETLPLTANWPWGLSALTVGVQYTKGKIGVTGKAPQLATPIITEPTTPVTADPPGNATPIPYTLWWHAPHHQVQFRSAIADRGPTAGLPSLFRAVAIKSLLPTLAQLAFPTATALDASDKEEALVDWQPVLPGALRYLLLGARPGAMLAIRNQLLRQRGLTFLDKDASVDTIVSSSVPVQHNGASVDTFVSGSVPVQHRVPRPVPLPENQVGQEAVALQTWASYGTPTQTVLALAAPVDEAFFAECGPAAPREPVRRLQMRMVEPVGGTISSQWTGRLQFQLHDEVENAETSQIVEPVAWETQLEIISESISISFGEPFTVTTAAPVVWPLSATDLVTLRQLMSLKSAGDVIYVQAHVKPKASTTDFRQTLTFPLRVTDERQLRLPLAPRFTLFEDPEYNRRLASLAGRAEQIIQLEKVVGVDENGAPKKELLLQTVSLSTDRREYNPDSIVALRFDWDDGAPDDEVVGVTPLPLQNDPDTYGTISLRQVDSKNVPFNLATPANEPKFAKLQTGKFVLLRFALADLKPTDDTNLPGFRPGDSLLIKLTLPPAGNSGLTEEKQLELTVNIIAEPVIPMPEAAYGLLRRQTVGEQVEVECVRFAWGPQADRIELICPDDLTQEVVRRRAVFKWQDSVRPAANDGPEPQYAVQKITQSGATHFPPFDD